MGNNITIQFDKKVKIILVVIIFAILLLFLSNQRILKNTKSEHSLNVVTAASDYAPKNFVLSDDLIELNINKGSYEFIEEKKTEVYSYNEQIPGPLIYGKVGKNQKIKVYNNLDVPTTVHWHGLQLANVEDGVPQVTQNPIQPGEFYDYVIEFRNEGLYWYHSHVDAHEQVESGLQGVILVTEEDSSQEGNLLVLDDVLLGNDYQLRNFNLGVMHGRFGNVMLVNGKVNSAINLENNRLRIVNTANARSFNIQFSNKEFTVIGMDIGSSDQFTTNILTIHPGERYDVLLPTDLEEEVTLTHYTRRGSIPLATLIPSNEEVAKDKVNSFELLFDVDELMNKDPDHYASLKGVRGGHMGIIWSINDKYFPNNPEVFEVEEGKTIKLRLKNTQGQPHPMHLHGQKFIILSRDGIREKHFGWKDTVMVGSNEEVDIVFVAEEKGEWVFHCHILEHAEAGMLSVVKVN